MWRTARPDSVFIYPPLLLNFRSRLQEDTSHHYNMGLGILEPANAHQVPGTVLLDQVAAHSEGATGQLKHASGGNSNIVLSPQPSEDPNDPLNWSSTKKHIVLFIVFLGVIIFGVVPVRSSRQLVIDPVLIPIRVLCSTLALSMSRST